MFERFSGRARQVVVQAQHNARRYGHNFIGPEHLFLGIVSDEEDPVSAVLRDLGLTPERTEAAFARLTRSQPLGPSAQGDAQPGGQPSPQPGGLAPAPADPAANPLAGLDADALASIGIDLDEVRTRIEATFGPGALSRAASRSYQCEPRRPLHRRLLRRRGRGHPARRPGRPGPAQVRGHIPFTPRAKKSLELSLREALSLGDNYIGMEHLALALTSMRDGLVFRILAELDVTPATIRAALLDQHRKAS